MDWLLSLAPKAGTAPATLYVGLFVGASQSTVPDPTSVLSTYTGVSETAYSGYARQPVTAAQWGMVGEKTTWGQTGRGTTASQVSFPASTATYETLINGFFLTTSLTHGAEVAIWYSNFNDNVGIASMAVGDIIRVTPTWQYMP